MLQLLCQAIQTICATYTLAYPESNKKASADFLIPALIIVILKAKLTNSFAMIAFLRKFGQVGDESGFEDVCLTNFLACNEYLLNLRVEDLELSEEELSMPEVRLLAQDDIQSKRRAIRQVIEAR